MMAQPNFREDKATQAACLLIQKEGGEINYMKLIKLLYIADRKRLLSKGRPITFDTYYSLDLGPILSNVRDLITTESAPGVKSVWKEHISMVGYRVQINKTCSLKPLSQAEIAALEQTYNELGHFNQWKISDWTHQHCPEWKNPDGSAIRIEYRDILMRNGKTEMEAVEIEKELQALAHAERCFGF